MKTIKLEEFINTIFQDTNEGETPLLSKQIDLGGAFANGDLAHAKRWLRGKAGAAVYFNVSTVRVPAEGEKLRRRKADCVAAYAVVLDDIGSKVDDAHPEPSWVMETSKDNLMKGGEAIHQVQ